MTTFARCRRQYCISERLSDCAGHAFEEVAVTIFHEHGDRAVCFWCPGCEQAHCVSAGRWTIDREALTISPSVLVGGTQWAKGQHFYEATHANVPEGERTTCHSFVTGGRIQFLEDSTHDLAGQTVDLPEWPIGR